MNESKESNALKIGLYLLLVLLGLLVALAILGDFKVDEVFSLLGVGVAASLIASGIAGLFVVLVVAPQAADTVKKALDAAIGHPAHVMDERRFLNREFVRLTHRGELIDIISLTLQGFTDNTDWNDLDRWLLEEGKVFRVLVLKPGSEPSRYRGGDEGRQDLDSKIVNSLGRVAAYCERLRPRQAAVKGSFEVRVFDSLPYFAYLRSDDEVMMGLYYRHAPGIQSEVIRLSGQEVPVVSKLQSHFDSLWEDNCPRAGSESDRLVCRVDSKDAKFVEHWLRGAEPEDATSS